MAFIRYKVGELNFGIQENMNNCWHCNTELTLNEDYKITISSIEGEYTYQVCNSCNTHFSHRWYLRHLILKVICLTALLIIFNVMGVI